MEIRILKQASEFQKYDAWVKSQPLGNLWQSLERKQYLEALGKEVRLYLAEEDKKIMATALVMIDRTSFGFSTWDVPRGPVWSSEQAAVDLLERIGEDAKQDRCLALYYSPLVKLEAGSLKLKACRLPLISSPRFIQAEATRLINLSQSEEEILAQMKPKGRYNIRVADKHDVQIWESEDIEAYYKLAKATGARDNYTIVSKKKYETFLKHLPGSFLLLAYPPLPAVASLSAVASAKDEAKAGSPSPNPSPIAGLLGVIWNNQAIYYYGASDHAHRALMAPYALQWAAIQKAKLAGCETYDLLGIAPPGSEGHPWQGITSFKEKFGGQVVAYPPEQMTVFKPWVMKGLEVKRRFV